MFDESNLHLLITGESRRRDIPLTKLLRESLQAAADGKFTVRSDSKLSPDWREECRRLAAVAEAQRDWHWWHQHTWSQLKLLLVKEAEFLAWLDGATKHPLKEPAADTANPALKPAPKSKIDEAMSAEYEDAKQQGGKPPNVKEIVGLVQKRLRGQGSMQAAGKFNG